MKKGFTLAEVLITLGIIGIIAAMTLPSVVQKYKNAVLKTSFKKAYSNCAQALLLAKAELGADNLQQSFAQYNGVEYVNSQMFIDAYYKQLKVMGNVEYKKNIKNYTLKRDFQADSITCLPTNILPDGSSMCTNIWAATISVTVDINGPEKGPNAFGHDIFMFRVDENKDILVGQKPEERDPDPDAKYAETDARPCSVKYSTAGNGLGCSYYALSDECPDKKGKDYWDCLPK